MGRLPQLLCNQQPRVILFDVCLRVTLFTDNVGVRKLLVYGDSIVQHGCAAVDVDDVVTPIHSVVVREG